MRVLTAFTDKLLGTLAPESTAQAAVCEWRKCGPQGTGLRQCCLVNGVWKCGICNLP